MSFIIEPFRETIQISRDELDHSSEKVESRADMKTEMNISTFLCLVRSNQAPCKSGKRLRVNK